MTNLERVTMNYSSYSGFQSSIQTVMKMFIRASLHEVSSSIKEFDMDKDGVGGTLKLF